MRVQNTKKARRHTGCRLFPAVLTALLLLLLSACEVEGNQETPTAGAETQLTLSPTAVQEGILDKYKESAREELDSASEEVKRSLTNVGNTARIRTVLEKLESGEEVTLAYIGGSITEGYTVNKNECYAYQVTSYLQVKYNNLKVKYVNAGISGTPSTIGMMRLNQDVLVEDPDMVVVEFAVNDAQDSVSQMMYESLVKECLMHESAPAVILLLTVTETGYSCEQHMTGIGAAYQLPVINVKEAVWPEIEAGNLTWDEYSKDEAHPSKEGHQRILEYFQYYFNTVLVSEEEEEPDYASCKAYGAAYLGMTLYNNHNLVPDKQGGFIEGVSGINGFDSGWSWGRENNDPFVFRMKGKNLFILYGESTNASMGTLEVYVDGKKKATINSCASDAYNNAEFTIVLNGALEEEHTVELKMAEGSEDKVFKLLGIGTTGTIESKEIVDEKDIPYTERAVLNEGNVSRIQEVMARAEAGEELTIGFIGGSITQGSGASLHTNCYARQVFDWWKANYPDAQFNYLNAGIGATTSQFACARAESDLLQYKPDFVVVEFSVNDESGSAYADSYESLIRTILTSEWEPAVLVLNMVQYDNGYNVQVMHNKIAEQYDLPIISMKDSIYKEIVFKRLTAAQVSGDNLHPNDLGHTYAAEIVTNFLGLVKNKEVSSDTGYSVPETQAELTWKNAVRHDNRNAAASLNGFEEDTAAQNGITDIFKNGYKAKNVGDSITFTVEGTDIALQYRKTNLMGAPKALVIIDGDEENAVELDGNYPDGWGDWLYLHNVYSGSENTTHTVEIRITEEGTRDFYLVSLITK